MDHGGGAQTTDLKMKRLVLFDLDHTLLDGDSNSLWIDYLVANGQLPTSVLARQAQEYARYQNGTLDIAAYLRFHLGLLTARPESEWLSWRQRFIDEVARPLIPASARATVTRHRQEGTTLAMVTATHAFLAAGFGRLFDLPVVATPVEVSGGSLSGNFIGEPCFGEGKVDALMRWLLHEQLIPKAFSEIWFYSDSSNDLPLLRWVSHPVVVNADAGLIAWASKHGWPMESWRVED